MGLAVGNLPCSKKIKSPAWNSLDEVIRDICSEFWADVFGVESASLHTDNTVSKARWDDRIEYFRDIQPFSSTTPKDQTPGA